MSAIALARSYTCIFGAPVLRAVDPAIFSLRYFTHCMSCGFCKDACCSYGVDIDVENVARLKALGPDFADAIGVSQAGWFTGEVETDAEFPGGAATRTQVRDGACVFLDRQNRGCKIHAYALAHGIDYHRLKPLVSVLFPLTFEHGVLVPSGEAEDGTLICAGDGPSLYEGGRVELAYYFGDALVTELDAIHVRTQARTMAPSASR